MQKPAKKIIIIFFILFYALQGLAQQPADILRKADSLFAKSKHTQAFQNYESLFKQNYFSPAMLLKMAYICESKNKFPQAQFYLSLYFKTTNDFSVLEKQQSLADKHNLAGYQLSDSARLLWMVNSYGRYFSFLVLMLALVLFLVQVGLYKKRKSLVFPVMLIFLVGSSLVLNYLTKPTEQGIIIASKTFAMDGPSGAANVVTQVTPGSKVEVLDRNDIWVKVSLNDKFFYVRYDALQIITF
jgi:hypothetical protein